MCLNSGEMTTDNFIFKIILEEGGNDKGGKMTESITVFNIFKNLELKMVP